MKDSFGAIISSSFEWTTKILFRPFSAKRWIILAFVAILAGSMNFNPRLNFNLPLDDIGEFFERDDKFACRDKIPLYKNTPDAFALEGTVSDDDKLADDGASISNKNLFEGFWQVLRESSAFVIVLIGFCVIVFICFLLLSMWLNARFKFIFLDNVVSNDASIRKPWGENKQQGNALFTFNVVVTIAVCIVIGLFVIATFALLNACGIFADDVEPAVSAAIGWGALIFLAFVMFMLFLVLFSVVIEDFVIPIMYKEKISVLESLRRGIRIVKKNVGVYVLYCLLKMGLGVGAFFIASIISFVIMLLVLLVIGLIGLMIYFVCKGLPDEAQMMLKVVLIVIGVPVSICVGFLINCVFLPIPVFFRTFGLKFLASLDEQYDLFQAT